MLGRFSKSWRAGSYDGTSYEDVFDNFDEGGSAIHIEELMVDHHDPFRDEEPHHSRWLITTCVAGIAGSLIAGGVLIGALGYLFPQSAVTIGMGGTFWQQSYMTAKSDFVGATTSEAHTREIALSTGAPSRSASGGYPVIAEETLPYQRVSGIVGSDNTAIALKAPQPAPIRKTVSIAEGQDLETLLKSVGATSEAAAALSTAVGLVYPPEAVRVGLEFAITLEHRPDFYGEYIPYPTRLVFTPLPGEKIIVEADERGRYFARVDGGRDGTSVLANMPYQRVLTNVSTTLYASARQEGIPEPIIAEVMRVHSFEIDFQRDLHEGDEFEVFYGRPLSEEDDPNKKVVLYSALNLQGTEHSFYRFTTPDDGVTDYYDADGQSVRKALMRTPVSGARMSSGFGMREHPILGYSRMHRGVDFAAPTGTPIKAAGDGVVEVAGRVGAYGNYVRIRHNSTYKTAYAHMSRIARGIDKGARVRQGQVIGYVGATGRVTGPHLHYEVLLNDKQVNPMTVRIPSGRKLEGTMLAKFQEHRQTIDEMMQAIPTTTQIAQANASNRN